MTDWPAGLSVAPLGEWSGVRTPESKRRRSPFMRPGGYKGEGGSWVPGSAVPLRDTLALLTRELREIRARDIVLLVALPPEKFRMDGRPRADAVATDPGVVLTFETPVGRMSYPCDTFTTWESNLRGIALGLEALRKVSRYGIAEHGEQYRSYLAVEAARAMPSQPFHDADSALEWLVIVTGANLKEFYRDNGGNVYMAHRSIVRLAKRIAHPDHGGTNGEFDLVVRAEALLRDAGLV